MNAERAPDRSRWLLPVAAVAAFAYAVTFNHEYPIREWLFTRVVGYWVFAGYFAAGCLSFGLWVVDRLTPRQYRPTEAVFVAFPLGILAFALATFGVAALGRLGTPFFFVAPGTFLFLGWPSLQRAVRRLRTLLVESEFRASRLDVLAFAFGAVGLVLVYAPILTPQNIQHDARWYHLPIAQEYASCHGLARFPEGWFLGAYPHLSSLLYAWALLWPMGIVDRLELCAHVEFIVFLFTVASVPALVRRLVPGLRLPASWAAFFLFPGFLVYDSNLSTGADHIAAVWAPAGLIVLLAALRTLSLRHAVLLGALAGGAALTKYSAICVALPLLAFLAVGAARTAARGRHIARAALAVAAAGGTFVVVWAPHWLKNWLFYGDPLYPTLAGALPAHPWNAQAAEYFKNFVEHTVLRPTHDLRGVLESIKVALTLGFEVHEYGFHGEVPTFGFLFAASLYCLPFVRARRGMFVVYGLGLSSAVVWFWTNHRDRYLQACLPWLVAATVSVLALSFRERGKRGRLAAMGLVGAQVVCGAGIFLLPVHIMTPGGHPLPHLMNLVKAGFDKNYDARFQPYPDWGFADWTAIGQLLPKPSRVLVHEDRLWLGLDAPVVVDEAAWQGGIRYSAFANASEVYDAFRRYGVTHIVTGQNHGDGGDHGIAGDLVFWDFLSGHAREVAKRGKLTLWSMPAGRPAPSPVGRALVLTCNQSEPLGLYEFSGLQDHQPLEEVDATQAPPDDMVARAEYVVIEDECNYRFDRRQLSAFRLLKVRGKVRIHRRVRA